ncbi:MAG: cbb3-type cytochrome c oxidase subunit I, partial [Planctomycetota bacterium]
GGRRMSDTLGKIHIATTYVAFNGTFGLMHVLGILGMPRRYAEPTKIDLFADLAWAQQAMTVFAVILGAAQLIFVASAFGSFVFNAKTRRGKEPQRAVEKPEIRF